MRKCEGMDNYQDKVSLSLNNIKFLIFTILIPIPVCIPVVSVHLHDNKMDNDHTDSSGD